MKIKKNKFNCLAFIRKKNAVKEFTLLNYSNNVCHKIITTINHSSGISNDEKIPSLIFLKHLFQQHLDAHSGSSMMDVYIVDHLVLG